MHKRARQVSSNLNDKYTSQVAIQVADHWRSFYLWSNDWSQNEIFVINQRVDRKLYSFLLVESFWKTFGKKVCSGHICITIAFPQFSNCRLKQQATKVKEKNEHDFWHKRSGIGSPLGNIRIVISLYCPHMIFSTLVRMMWMLRCA